MVDPSERTGDMPTSTNGDEERLRRYLLKLAPDDELDRIEDAYLATSEYEGVIGDVERRLVSDYVQGRLTQKEKEAFGNNYLVTDERREEVAIAEALKSSATVEGSDSLAVSPRRILDEERRGGFQRLLDWLGAPGPVLGLAAATTTVVLLSTNVVLFVRWREQAHQTQAAGEQIRRLRASRESAATPVKAARVLVIPSLRIEETDLSRGEERKLAFRLPGDLPDMVEIPLELPQIAEGAVVDAALSASGQTVWAERGVKLRVAGGAQYADLQVPFASLHPHLGRQIKLEIVERDHASLATFQLSFETQKVNKTR
jgi:hypothetical protein